VLGGGVACLETASGSGRQSDSSYVSILDLIEEVKETLFDLGPDERTERGKHIMRCQLNKDLYHGAVHLYVLVSVKIKENHVLFCSWRSYEESIDNTLMSSFDVDAWNLMLKTEKFDVEMIEFSIISGGLSRK